ncbi:MAG: hypothetical protein WCX09_02090 [Patescibacteria group bacterium]
MANFLKNWWRKRSQRYYFKKHRWHLITDIFLLILIIALGVGLILIKKQVPTPIDITPIPHVVQVPTESEEAINLSDPFFSGNINARQVFNFEVELENPDLRGMEEIDIQFLSDSAKFRIVSVNASEIIVINKDGEEGHSLPVDIKSRGDHLSIENLRPGQKIKIQSKLTATPITDDRVINWKLSAQYKQEGQKKVVNQELKPLALISELNVGAAAYYHSEHGDQLGIGPLPPLVGLPTNYWIFLSVENEGNILKNFTLTARLAEGLTLGSGRTVSQGDLIYDEATRRITWIIPELGALAKEHRAGFNVQLIPSEEQIGQIPELINNISYIATDSFTKEQLSGNLPNITTDLIADKLNQGQGVVAP